MFNLDEEKRFCQARKQLVVKRVDAIQRGRHSFTMVENKAVNYMLSKVKPDDTVDTEYKFHIGEFCRMVGWKNRLPTKEILGMLQTIANKSWWIVTDEMEREYELKHWFDVVRLNEGQGTITITFSKTVAPYIFNLLEQQKQEKIYLASWEVDAVSLMKNPYSQTIFELLRTYEFNNEEWWFENGTGTERDLQVIIAERDQKGKPLVPKTWKNWANFERSVLAPAKKEINKYTDLVIDYEPLKRDLQGNKYRRYIAIRFRLDEKSEIEKEEKERIIAREYGNEVDYEQITLTTFEQERRIQKEISNAELVEREIERSRFPLLKSEFPEFNDEQLGLLYIKANSHIIESVVEPGRRELWISDYISEYYNFIKATPEQTKTNTFARLIDYVNKDYKDYSYSITLKYDRSQRNGLMNMPEQSFVDDASEKMKNTFKNPIDVHYEVKEETSANFLADETDEMFEMRLLNMMKNVRRMEK